jgi:lipopolysaccharide/colanic/teichoic acid biosynthesis glycosyltransferase
MTCESRAAEAAAVGVGPGRRALDVLVAASALVLLAPVLLAVAALVGATSRGPVLFRQRRVGQGGGTFVLLKFRSMSVGHGSGPQVTSHSDTRVTKVGRVLRRTSLDELPQLLNVLRGQMTLVGPRPETVELAARYPECHRWVLLHRPGLTGPCQIRLRDHEVVPSDVADLEDYYLTVLVPRRVVEDASYLEAPTVASTLRVLAETAAYLLGYRPRSRASVTSTTLTT